MIHVTSLEARVAASYGALSHQLRKAADYAMANPVDLATRSLRAMSTASDVSPATFSRLARALGYDDFEEMREHCRLAVGRRLTGFSEKAAALQSSGHEGPSMLVRQSTACMANITALTNDTDAQALERAANCLQNAHRVLMFGALGSTGAVEYMAYLASYFAPNWTLAGRMGASLGGAMSTLDQSDAVLIITKTPYVRRAVKAAELAQQAGASVILLTDLHQCPAIPLADHVFVVPSESPQFFSSYVATLVLIETLIAMIVASSEVDASSSIRAVEESNRALGEYWAD